MYLRNRLTLQGQGFYQTKSKFVLVDNKIIVTAKKGKLNLANISKKLNDTEIFLNFQPHVARHRIHNTKYDFTEDHGV